MYHDLGVTSLDNHHPAGNDRGEMTWRHTELLLLWNAITKNKSSIIHVPLMGANYTASLPKQKTENTKLVSMDQHFLWVRISSSYVYLLATVFSLFRKLILLLLFTLKISNPIDRNNKPCHNLCLYRKPDIH